MLAGSTRSSGFFSASTSPVWKSTRMWLEPGMEGGEGRGTAALAAFSHSARPSRTERRRSSMETPCEFCFAKGMRGKRAFYRGHATAAPAHFTERLLGDDVKVADAQRHQPERGLVGAIGALEGPDAHAIQAAVGLFRDAHRADAGALEAGFQAERVVRLGEGAELDVQAAGRPGRRFRRRLRRCGRPGVD